MNDEEKTKEELIIELHELRKENNELRQSFEKDNTAHKKAEEANLKSKQQLETLVARIPVGVYILRTKPDYTFALEYASPVMAKILDLSVDSLLTHNETTFNAIHPDDLEGFVRLNQEGIILKRPFDWKGRAVVKGVSGGCIFHRYPSFRKIAIFYGMD